MLQSDRYDVAVIGGGPAGCAAAAVAAQQGLSVVLLERSPEPVFKIGESLMPETYWTLERMGALERMKESPFVHKHSVQFFSKNGKASTPFYFRDEKDHESAQTWQVLRSEFDQLLLDVAAEQGAECHRGASVREILFDGDRVTGLEIRDEEGSTETLACRVLIDATGQSTLLAKHLDLGKVDYGLKHSSYFTHYRGAFRDSGRDEGATLILQTESGDSWFWYIPLHDDVVSVGVVGPVAYLKRPGNSPEETFLEEVGRCAEISRRLEGAERCRPVQVLKDFSYRFKRMSGDGWILIGDAFSFIDPVYSSGIFLALKSGEMAADAAVEACRTGDTSATLLGRFEPRLMAGVEAVRRLVESFYSKDFSFGAFLRRYPERQSCVTRILIGDIFERDFSALFTAMEEWRQELASREALTTENVAR